MGKKARKFKEISKPELFDDYATWDDDSLDADLLNDELLDAEWGSDLYPTERFSARRKIERYADMKRLRASLDDWGIVGTA